MITIFRASLWDEAEPLPPALRPDVCHSCHRTVARLAGVMTAGPCFVLCPDCYTRRTLQLERHARQPRPRWWRRAARRAAPPLRRTLTIIAFVVVALAIVRFVLVMIAPPAP